MLILVIHLNWTNKNNPINLREISSKLPHYNLVSLIKSSAFPFPLWISMRQGFLWHVCLCQLTVYKRKDVVGERQTKLRPPPPQPTSPLNKPKLLLILNSFVSRTTHRRPYLWVWACVHPRQSTQVCARRNEIRCVPSFYYTCVFPFHLQLSLLLHLIYLPFGLMESFI